MTFTHRALISIFAAGLVNCAWAQSPPSLDKVVNDYLCKEIAPSADSHICWESYWPMRGGPPGGIIWAAVLPVSPKTSVIEQIILVNDTLGEQDPFDYFNESSSCYVVANNGSTIRQDGNISKIIGKRQEAGRYQYLEPSRGKGIPPERRVLTAVNGKLVEVLKQSLPKSEDDKYERDTRSEEDFKRWQTKAFAWPDGFKKFSTTWRWIPLAEFITAKEARWRDGDSPKTKEDFEKLAKETPRVTWDEFVEWCKKNKAKDKPAKNSK